MFACEAFEKEADKPQPDPALKEALQPRGRQRRGAHASGRTKPVKGR